MEVTTSRSWMQAQSLIDAHLVWCRFHSSDPQSDRDSLYSSEGNIYFGLSPRMGDINLDGYPDIMIRMENEQTGQVQMQVGRKKSAWDSGGPKSTVHILY